MGRPDRIDEGRLPNTVYEARGLVEDPQGALWVSGSDGKMLHVEVFPTGMRDSKVQILSRNEGLIEGNTDVEFVAGNIFATFDRSKNIFRWDTAAKKFVIDNRFLLPIDAPDVTSFLGPVDDRNFWAVTISSDSRRLGLFTKQGDGTWRVEEDPYRRLNRLSLFQNQFSEPGGDVWITGERLIRFRPGTNANTSQTFPTVVRQMSAGPRVVFGGANVAGSSDLRLPPGSNG